MITRGGIGTLAAGGGIVAAVVCLLVGIQLLLLGAEIGTWIQADPEAHDPATGAWQALVHVSGLLALVAAGLVLLLVVAHRQGWHTRNARFADGGQDIEDVSVRIFEVDSLEQAFEVTSGDESRRIDRTAPAKTPLQSPETVSRDILDEIDRVAGGPPGDRSPAAPESWRRFLARFFGGLFTQN
jgi:hypothetical protein